MSREGHDTYLKPPHADCTADELPQMLAGATGEPLTVANEFAEVIVRRVATRNGLRLLIQSPKSGRWVSLDALELEALTRQNTTTLAAIVGNIHAPLIPGDDL